MKPEHFLRTAAIVVFMVSCPANAAVLFWQVGALQDWENPEGPAHQKVFLTNNGTRMMVVWESQTLVVPMEESNAKQYETQIRYQPLTVNPLLVLPPPPPPPSNGGSPGGTGSAGGTGGTGGTGGPATEANASTEIPEPSTLLTALAGLMTALAVKGKRV